ncbi:hypothetical protein IWW38_001515 [Coemansia aciculifera]|uniref:Uncharacterized protein n=1 Tax=Coemansia aciculifera TaxID=417176 RepID=A0ACC1M6Q1_9FUNG|nr:hypothetical protein IWW38_001515 [Coemansia aciculifera]
MVGRAVDENESGGSKGFSLFSAINGLFERARSSAEKESQRLFTSPMPQSRQAKERRRLDEHHDREATPAGTASEQSAVVGGGSPRSALPESLAMTKRRPRPARSHSSKAGLASRNRSTPSSRSPPFRGSSPEKPSAEAFSQPVVTDEEPQHDIVDVLTPTLNAVSKRKRSVRRSPSPMPETYTDSPKRARAGAEDRGSALFSSDSGAGIRTPDLTPLDTGEQLDNELSHEPVLQLRETSDSAFAMPPAALQRTSTVSTVVSDSTYMRRNELSVSTMRTSEYMAPRRVEAAAPHSTALGLPRHGGASANELEMPSPRVSSIVEPTPVVERARLEKVERELHRLKKIIASLLPNELNDDDLRSVYGDLDQYQPRRMSSDDIIMQLMKTRLGAAGQFSGGGSSELPPSPTSNSPTNYGLSAQSMPPPSAPPPPPMHPAAAAMLLAARESSSKANGRPRSVASLLRRDSGASDTASSILGDFPPVHSATVRRLRAELRPVSANSQQMTPKQMAPPPPPPHKDPGVMTQLLEEMKHHKLRSVRKPRDMSIH